MSPGHYTRYVPSTSNYEVLYSMGFLQSSFVDHQTSAMAVAYVYSGYMLLPYQLLLPLVACTVGVLCMFLLERRASARLTPDNEEQPSSDEPSQQMSSDTR